MVDPYGGSLTFPSVTDAVIGRTYPSVTIPLYLQQYNTPIRKQKIVELTTLPVHSLGWDTSTRSMFYGSNDPLTTTMSGFFITPMTMVGTKKIWTPTSNGVATGTSLNLTGVCYPELILAYIEGRMSRISTRYGSRVDPSSFTDPYGTVYSLPIITEFDAGFTVTGKKQTFSCTLWLGA